MLYSFLSFELLLLLLFLEIELKYSSSHLSTVYAC